MKIIEFIGMPRAGKTTQMNRLKSHLESRGFRVVLVTDRERALSVKTSPTEGLAYTLVFFTAVIEAYFQYVNAADYLLIDRGCNDVAVWSDVRFAFGEISQQECDALKEAFRRFAQRVDVTCYFQIPIEIACARHENAEHHAVDEVAMDKRWLEVLQDAYRKNLPTFKNVVMIDGTQEPDAIEQQIIKGIE
jgi:thymidylate kinase